MSTSARNYRDSGIGEDFAPPPGPPPPIMPEGWIAKFDEHYQQLYYVNTATKQSQWDKPPGTIDPLARAPGEFERPPSYNGKPTSSFYNRDDTTARPITPRQQFQPQSQCLQTTQPASSAPHSPSRGLAGCPSSSLKSRSPKHLKQQQQYYTPQGYLLPTTRSPILRRLGIYASSTAQVRNGTWCVAALGAGGGLLGGMMLADAFDDHNGYEQGFEDGADFGGGYGGDTGDFGGGDF